THDAAVAALAERRVHLRDGRVARDERGDRTPRDERGDQTPRDERGSARDAPGALERLVFFTACLAVGVAGVVAVAGLSASLDRGIRGEAKQLLAADLAVSS